MTLKNGVMAALIALTALAAQPAVADDDDDAAFLREIRDYLAVSETFVSLADKKEAAVFFAVEGIVEIHEARGEQAKAVPALQAILDKYPDNRTVRNIVRFKLHEVYKEIGSSDAALAELDAVIDENR